MMKNNISVQIFETLLFSILIFSSCHSSDRTNIIAFDFSPNNGTVVYIGDPIVINSNIVSDNDLLSYKIELNKTDTTTVSSFEVTKTGFLKNKEAKLSEVIDVPLFIGENENLVEEGNYSLVVTIEDDSKKELVITRNLILKNK